jgi:putative flippase GtrA
MSVGGLRRFLRYSTVGAMGLALKFSTLAALVELARLPYLAATAVAVETVMLHNFAWHVGWTWHDRCGGLTRRAMLARLLRFHLVTGAVALAANLLLMRLLVGGLSLHYLLSNIAATVASGVANFLLSGRLVFAPTPTSRQP